MWYSEAIEEGIFRIRNTETKEQLLLTKDESQLLGEEMVIIENGDYSEDEEAKEISKEIEDILSHRTVS